MADHNRHQHRPHRISLPPRTTAIATTTTRSYPSYPYPSITTPTPTPSKTRLSSLSSNSKSTKFSISFLFLLLFSLRSLYSLLPFLRSSPSFSLFPFSFLVSLLSFLFSLSFSLFPYSQSTKDPFLYLKQNQPFFSLSSISPPQRKVLLAKSLLLAVVFLLRFQALRYCGTAAMILAELSGNVAAKFVVGEQKGDRSQRSRRSSSKVRGFVVLFLGLFLLSISWDRVECFPFSTSFIEKWGFPVYPRDNCLRIWPMLLPFLSGFLGCYERDSMNWGTIEQLGRKRVRLISLFFTTIFLFVPAVMSIIFFESDGDGVSIGNLGWPLANIVVFGVLLSENYGDEKLVSSKNFQREFLITCVCTVVLELFYFPELSLWGLLLCGLLLYFAVRELDPIYSNYHELGSESSESFTALFMKPIHHILSERKSRKIALFLLINAGYMVVEFVAGFMSNSLGLISDACHMLFDCAALAIGLYASYISRLPANNQFNYGRGRFEVLSGYVNAVFLVLVGVLIVLESFERILDPQEVSTNSLLAVSIGGLLVNVVGLIFFHEEHHHAHGGSGCMHSHSHSHSHSHHDHHHQHNHAGHHECDGKDHEFAHDHHDHHHHNQQGSAEGCRERQKNPNAKCYDHHDHVHDDHHDHVHNDHHDHHGHAHNHPDHHGHAHNHPDHHGHAHNHDHYGHAHNHDHYGHAHNHDHHGHAHQHDHVGHAHNSDHSHKHHIDYSVKESLLHSSRASHSHSFEWTIGGNPHAEGARSDSQTHHSDRKDHSSSEKLKLAADHGELQKHHHRHIDHNMEGIFLHVLADTMGSVGVVISTLLIKYKGWVVADPACSIFISVLIVSSVIPLLRNCAEILLQRVPRAYEKDLKEAINDIMKIKGVGGIQNLHVWSFTNTDVVSTLHLHVSAESDHGSTKKQVSQILRDAGIKDLTLQIEGVK